MEWLESRQLKIAPPKRTKKITGKIGRAHV